MKSCLRAIRERRGLRREDLAAQSKVSYSTIQRLEISAVGVGLDVARALAESLGVTVDELFPPGL